MKPSRYFDAHLHMKGASAEGLNGLLARIDGDRACVGGNLVINTETEFEIAARFADRIPPWLQVVPGLELLDRCPPAWASGWVKLHPQVHAIRLADVPRVVERVRARASKISGVMVHCFPWGRDLEFNCSLQLVSSLAQNFPQCRILATHGGGYESWAFRAHVGGFKNVLFDFSATLAYYEGSDLLRPLQRYLMHSPDRVLFGSDWPTAEVESQWAEMERWAEQVGIAHGALEALLLENSRRTWPNWTPRS